MSKSALVPLIMAVQLNLVPACTVFSVSTGDVAFVGNNEDWVDERPYIKILPAKKGKHGRIYFGFDKKCKYPFGGVNDQGLFYDIASLTQRRDIAFDPNKRTRDNGVYETMLEMCASVDAGLHFLRQYNIAGMRRHHIMIADKTGASAMVEWGKDKPSVVHKRGPYQVMTNFNVTDPPLAGGYPCWRYSRAKATLAEADEISVETCRRGLDAVHQTGKYATVYSNIYDLKKGAIHVFLLHDFRKCLTIRVSKVLKDGEQAYYLPSLFAKGRFHLPER